MILSDQARDTYVHMLTERMRWARRAEQVYFNTASNDGPDGMWNVPYKTSDAADEEVRSMIREIARMCRFDSEQVNEITSVAWTASKEDM